MSIIEINVQTGERTERPLTEAEIAALPIPTPKQIAAQYVDAVQAHMDVKARERRYDNIVSACSYAAAPNAFQAESQAYLAWRAACWQHLYQMQADVMAGTRTMPSIDELIAALPELVLP